MNLSSFLIRHNDYPKIAPHIIASPGTSSSASTECFTRKSRSYRSTASFLPPISVSAEFEKPVDVAQARAAVAAFPGAELVDDPANRLYPTPLDFTRKVKCGVGRIRKDTAFDNGLSFWVSGDNLWKGAALNAIQVAETLIARDLLRVPAA